jgi:phosphate transport system substrate-binding protein
MRWQTIVEDKRSRLTLIAASILSVALATAHADTIKVGGTGAALGVMRVLGDSFKTTHPTVDVVVVPGSG